MRRIKLFGPAVLVALALTAMLGVGSASAANWDPPNTNVHAHGTLSLITSAGNSVTCEFTTFVRSTGNDRATTVNASGAPAGPSYSGCRNSISSGLATTVHSTAGMPGSWTMTATSTTLVDVTNGGATITIGGICTISAMGIGVGGNTWSNSTHSLTANSGVNFGISESGICDFSSMGHMQGTITASPATIT